MSHSGLSLTETSMLQALDKLNTISQNVANVNTPAFKSQRSFGDVMDSLDIRAAKDLSNHISLQFSQGVPSQTGILYDLMVDGDGFFVINMTNGQQLLTRNGAFHVNDAGVLVTADGNEVASEMGNVRISGDFMVDETGAIWADDQKVDQLRIVTANPDELTMQGNGYYSLVAPATQINPENYSIRQGMLESSNVDVRKEFTDMIVMMRQFEMQQKVVRLYDQMMNTGISTLGEF